MSPHNNICFYGETKKKKKKIAIPPLNWSHVHYGKTSPELTR